MLLEFSNTFSMLYFRNHGYNLRNAERNNLKFTDGTGDSNELQVHFHVLLHPTFMSSEGMYIIMGPPIGNWNELRIALKSIR